MSETAFTFVGAGQAPDPGAWTWRSRHARMSPEEIKAMEDEEEARQERYRLWDAIDQRTRARSQGSKPLRIVTASSPLPDPSPTWTLADALRDPQSPARAEAKPSRPAPRTRKKTAAKAKRSPSKARSKPAPAKRPKRKR